MIRTAALLVLALGQLLGPAWSSANGKRVPRPASKAEARSLSAAPDGESGNDWRWENSFRTLVFGLEQEPSPTPYNPGNRFALDRYEAQLHVRPDLAVKGDRLELMLKPRLICNERWVSDGIFEGDRTWSAQGFVNEWLVRARVAGSLFLSYGRENLQWGPSTLVSCSNPFIVQNGRAIPQIEVPGLDYGRLVWAPEGQWTVSAIANVDEGRMQTFGTFEKIYAAKVDWTGHKKYGSLILSSTERRTSELGFFGVRNVSDPLMIYIEGRLAERADVSCLVGGSYTLVTSEMLTVEFFHDKNGTVPITVNLPSSVSPALVGIADLQRATNVVMVQYNTGTRFRNTNLTLRLDHILDDGTRFIGAFDKEIGSSNEVWLSAIVNGGGEATRFRQIYDHSTMLGWTHTF